MKVDRESLREPGFFRASADCVCPDCGKLYREHPHDKENLSYDDRPWLRILCNGERVKL